MQSRTSWDLAVPPSVFTSTYLLLAWGPAHISGLSWPYLNLKPRTFPLILSLERRYLGLISRVLWILNGAQLWGGLVDWVGTSQVLQPKEPLLLLSFGNTERSWLPSQAVISLWAIIVLLLPKPRRRFWIWGNKHLTLDKSKTENPLRKKESLVTHLTGLVPVKHRCLASVSDTLLAPKPFS